MNHNNANLNIHTHIKQFYVHVCQQWVLIVCSLLSRFIDGRSIDRIHFSFIFLSWKICLFPAEKTRTVRGSDYSPTIELSEQKDKLVTATGYTEKYSEKQANKVWLNYVYWFSRY